MGRIDIICSHLPPADVFADVGCDHGYCTQYMLQNDLCRTAYISDISAESLKKAERLLFKEVAEGRCIPVVCDGLKGIKSCDVVLIAGMGGEEIVHILSESYLPKKFVLQPMKNTEKVRRFLLERGARIIKDYTFEDGKFYDLIAGEVSEEGDSYTDWEYKFGRDNLRSPSPAFLRWVKAEKAKLDMRLLAPAMKRESREELRQKRYELEVILDATEGDV